VTNAERSGTALIKTTQLFEIARYLRETEDEAFAQTVREAIETGIGVVELPPVPKMQE
jgi:hypothetical protein